MSLNEMNDPWCLALHDCTACLRQQNPDEADMALAFLNVLEQHLAREKIVVGTLRNGEEEDDDFEDDKVPQNKPIQWDKFRSDAFELDDLETAMAKGIKMKTKRIGNNDNVNNRLSGQRLLTRIFTSQSELFATKAMHIAKSSGDWTLAGEAYETAILKIHKALDVTDTAISKWWNRWELGLELIVSEQEVLATDASIVVVALESLITRRDRLLSMGKREESRLLRKLQPQWESRDQVKERWGDRWTNNPRPKYDYAKLRAEMEADLKSLQKAMVSLEELDPNQALQKVSGLKEQLLSGNKRQSTNGSNGATGSMSSGKQEKHRYNLQRPSLEWMVLRVSLEDYPDPTDFGWTFTGSWEAVEFFERTVVPENTNDNGKNAKAKIVKLDWYFTTGTIKTSLDHPVQGKTQLFAKQCTPDLYAKVLTNPRTHTGKRYQRKPKQAQKQAHQLPHHRQQQQQQQLSH